MCVFCSYELRLNRRKGTHFARGRSLISKWKLQMKLNLFFFFFYLNFDILQHCAKSLRHTLRHDIKYKLKP